MDLFIHVFIFICYITQSTVAWTITSPLADGSSSISIPENTPNGTVVFTVQPSSTSWTSRLLVTTDKIIVEPDGSVKVNGDLDFENSSATHSYILNIRIEDKKTLKKPTSSNFVDRVLTIHVTNVFDVAPNITVSRASLTIPEEMPPATTLPVSVTATDLEITYGDQMTFSLVGYSSMFFKINPRTGSIFIKGRLDYEAGLQSANFSVKVTDKGGNTAKRSIALTVENINDNLPTCSPSTVKRTISENQAVGPVLTVNCTDADSSTANLNYSIASGNNPIPNFQMSGSTLHTTRMLDYEKSPMYTLTIHVVDAFKGITNTVTVTATIEVVDVNEYPPQWTSVTQETEIEENYSVGKSVFTCAAFDPDGQTGQTLTYSVVSIIDDKGTDSIGTFHINPTRGELSALVNLDYDSGSKKYTLLIQAHDGGTPTMNSTNLTLIVNVKDVNDNPPIFKTGHYTFSVNENEAPNKSIGTILATDADADTTNNVVAYGLGPSITGDVTHFTVDNSGTVSTTTQLDRETTPLYILTVKATDNGLPSLTGSATVTINVNDVNDCPPEFDSSSYSGSVLEGPTGRSSSILTMTLTDRDSSPSNVSVGIDNSTSSGIRASSFFTIARSGNTFKISMQTAVDREVDQIFIFSVIAVDSVLPVLTSTATVTVTVIDVNEPPVWITSSPISVSVPESVGVGFHITTVSATDGDLGLGGRIVYSLVSSGPRNVFQLNSATGELKTGTVLDFDTLPKIYTLKIEVSDRGKPSPTATPRLIVTISVTDVNDNAPVFAQNSYRYTVNENQTPGVGLSLSATDQDSSSNSLIHYEIGALLEGDSIPFTVSPRNSTRIVTTRRLDRETCDTYVITVLAVDGGTPALTGSTTVTVAVKDENDNSPVFDSQSYTGSVGEDAVSGTSVLTVTVTDSDIGPNGDITLSVQPNKNGAFSKFTIDSTTGVLSVKGNNVLDREKLSTLTFQIQAVDSGKGNKLTATASVTIYVIDVNDNVPYMDPLFHNNEVDYMGVCGGDIVTVTAFDNDVGNNSQLHYSLVHNPFAFLFKIDPDSGVFSLKSRTAKNFQYVIETLAQDVGSPPQTAAIPAIVRVDTFDPVEVAVTFRLGIDKTAFAANKNIFISQIEALVRVNHTGAILKVCCVELGSGTAIIPTTSRRRLLQLSSPADVHVYAMSDNTTDDVANINISKTFLTTSQLLRVFTVNPSGYPVSLLTNGPLEYFHIQTVTPYHLHITPWSQTVEGIVVITVSVILAVILIAVFIVVICYTYKRRKRPVIPVRQALTFADRPNVKENRPSRGKVPDLDEIKKNPLPSVISLPRPVYSVEALPEKKGEENATNLRQHRSLHKILNHLSVFDNKNSGSVVLNRDFEGTAVDDLTGRVYKYNTRTNDRQWLTTPEGQLVAVTHH